MYDYHENDFTISAQKVNLILIVFEKLVKEKKHEFWKLAVLRRKLIGVKKLCHKQKGHKYILRLYKNYMKTTRTELELNQNLTRS